MLGFECKHEGTSEFLYNLLYQDSFFDYMMLTSKGAKMPRGDKQAIMQFANVIPDLKLMQYFSAWAGSFCKTISSNKIEAAHLSQIRDSLLPKLLSGEISVSEAEDALSANNMEAV